MGRKYGIKNHGLSKTAEFKAWDKMISRCSTNGEMSKYYNERGIGICEKWKNSFIEFYKDMGKKPAANYSLDRIDNNKGYYKENCRWADKALQNLNRRVRLDKAGGLPRGVRSRRGTYFSRISINGYPFYIGTFSTAKEASDEFNKIYFEWYGVNHPG